MPLLSCFSPCGMLALSSEPSHAETIYKALVNSQGDAYRVAGGDLNPQQEAKLYAQAMGLARAQYALEGAGNQQFARKAWDLFPMLEKEHGLVPRPSDTLADRRGALSARMLLPAGASQVNVENALRDLLGDDFASYRPTPKAEAIVWPTNLGDDPMNLQLPSVPRKLIRITQAITVDLGSPQSVPYEDAHPDADGEHVLLVGDDLVVEPEAGTEAEVVTVTAVSTVLGVLYFTATFGKPHAADCLATTAPYPLWASTKRHSLVVLTATAAADAEKRRKVNELMSRIARGVSTWDVAGESAPGVAGPWKVGEAKLGLTPIGTITT